jgi:hypothetical protein
MSILLLVVSSYSSGVGSSFREYKRVQAVRPTQSPNSYSLWQWQVHQRCAFGNGSSDEICKAVCKAARKLLVRQLENCL